MLQNIMNKNQAQFTFWHISSVEKKKHPQNLLKIEMLQNKGTVRVSLAVIFIFKHFMGI